MSKFSNAITVVERLAARPDAGLNPEGGIAFAYQDKAALVAQVSCWLVKEPAFYGDQSAVIRERIARVAAQDPEWTAKLAVYLRKVLHLRSSAHVVLAHTAAAPGGASHAARALPRVCLRPDDLLEVAALLKDGRHGLVKRMPSAIRRALRARLSMLDEFQALRCRRRRHFNLGHLIRMLHPRPADARQSALFKHLRGRRLTGEDLVLLPRVAAQRELRAVARRRRRLAASIVERADLPWELALPLAGSSRRVWKALAPRLPMFALLRNLRNLIDKGVLDDPDLRASVLARFRDPTAVAASCILPFRWYAAWREIVRWHRRPGLWGLEPEELEVFAPDSGVVREVLAALEAAMDASIATLPRFPGRTVIAADLSGSMSWCTISRRSTLRPIDICSVLAAAARRLAEKPLVLGFADYAAPIRIPSRSGILKAARIVETTDVGGATYAETVLHWLTKHRVKADRILLLTDMVVYGDPRDAVPGNEVAAFQSAFHEYARKIAPGVRLTCLDLSVYQCFVMPQDDPRVTTIAGWSEGILRYVTTHEGAGAAGLVGEVDRVDLDANEPAEGAGASDDAGPAGATDRSGP